MVPSSPFLIARLIAHLNPRKVRVVVELGGGVGTITRAILKRLPAHSRLYVFEINERFVRELRKIHDTRLVVCERSAEDIDPALFGGRVDCVISSLPFSSCGQAFRQRVLSALQKTLSPDGVFLQYQYAPISYRFFKKAFEDVTIEFELRNVPPAFIYRCRKPICAV